MNRGVSSHEGERIHQALYDLESAARDFRGSKHGLSEAASLRLGVYWSLVNSGLFDPEQARAAMLRICNMS